MTKYYGIRAAGWLVYGMCPIATQGGYRTRRCLQRTPLGRFSKVDRSAQPRGLPTPNDVHAFGKRKALGKMLPAPTFSGPTTVLPTAVELNRAWQNQSRGVWDIRHDCRYTGSEVHETHAVGDNLYTPCTISFLFPINSRLIKSHSHSSFS